jgi:hypothetical protein
LAQSGLCAGTGTGAGTGAGGEGFCDARRAKNKNSMLDSNNSARVSSMVQILSNKFAKEVAIIALLSGIVGYLVTVAAMYSTHDNFQIERYYFWKEAVASFIVTAALVHTIYAMVFRSRGAY